MGLHEIKMFLYREGNNYQSEEIVYRMGKNVLQLYI
jgi:hypothetical protein